MTPDTAEIPLRAEWWQERDRTHIGVQREDTGEYVFSAWDQEARDLVEDGFVKWGDDQALFRYVDSIGALDPNPGSKDRDRGRTRERASDAWAKARARGRTEARRALKRIRRTRRRR